MTHLAKNCVTMYELMDKFYENTELSDVICEEYSKLSGKISKSNLKKHQSLLNPLMDIRIFLQRSECKFERNESAKIKQKLVFHHNIPCLFR